MKFTHLVQRLGIFPLGKGRAAARVKKEMRARVASLAEQGRSHVALSENLALLGIDSSRRERPEIVAVGSYHFDR